VNKFLAQIVSIAMHPVAVPSLLMLVLFNSGTLISFYPLDIKLKLFMIISVSTFVLPMVMFIVLFWLKMVGSVQMYHRKERIIPFLFSLFFYASSVYVLVNVKGLEILMLLMVAASIALFITLAVSFFWKISAHMVGMGGATGFLMALCFLLDAKVQLFLLLVVVLSGVVGSSRLVLQEHTPQQVYTGYFVGLISMLVVFFVI